MVAAKKFNLISLIVIMTVVSGCAKSLPGNQTQQGKDKSTEKATTTEVVSNATSSESVMSTSTKDWSTYQNAAYRFEVKYPTDWKIDSGRSSKNSIVFDNGVPSRESIEINRNDNNIDFLTFKAQKMSYYKSVTVNLSDFVIDNEKAFKIETSENGIKRIFFLHNDLIFEITTSGRMEKNGILNSFKFIEPQTESTNTKDWLTYRNEEYGFELRYQPFWEKASYDVINELSKENIKSVILFNNNKSGQKDVLPLLNISVYDGKKIFNNADDKILGKFIENKKINGVDMNLYQNNSYFGYSSSAVILLKNQDKLLIKVDQIKDQNESLREFYQIVSTLRFIN